MCVHWLFLLNYYFLLLSRKHQKSLIRHHLHRSVGYVAMVIQIIIFTGDPYRIILIETHMLNDSTGPANSCILVYNKNNYWLFMGCFHYGINFHKIIGFALKENFTRVKFTTYVPTTFPICWCVGIHGSINILSVMWPSYSISCSCKGYKGAVSTVMCCSWLQWYCALLVSCTVLFYSFLYTASHK